ncbi:MAG: Fur family transcriptional regulator [Phycisphaerales bacterium]
MGCPSTSQREQMWLDELRLRLAERGIRSTRQRESIFLALSNTKKHPTAEELMILVRQHDPEISQATIYNTLDILAECGLVNRRTSPVAGGACRYDANTEEHIHVIFDDGKLMDVPTDLGQQLLESIPETVLEEISKRTGIELSGIRIELLGHHRN